jgi:hypothetical protein
MASQRVAFWNYTVVHVLGDGNLHFNIPVSLKVVAVIETKYMFPPISFCCVQFVFPFLAERFKLATHWRSNNEYAVTAGAPGGLMRQSLCQLLRPPLQDVLLSFRPFLRTP